MCFGWLRRIICGNDNTIPCPELEPIELTEIFGRLRAELGEKCEIYLSDKEYKTTSIYELKKFLQSDLTDTYVYKKIFFDCDDFSYRLMGELSVPGWASLPFGIFWCELPDGSGHALNIFIDHNRKVWIVEPQNDEVTAASEYFNHEYKAWLVMM